MMNTKNTYLVRGDAVIGGVPQTIRHPITANNEREAVRLFYSTYDNGRGMSVTNVRVENEIDSACANAVLLPPDSDVIERVRRAE